MSQQSVYMIAARRTALGRIGGLHKRRRLPELAAPVVAAALADARLATAQVDELMLGNASEGGNPARIVALAAGLPETSAALTLDRQCTSSLEAIVAAVRCISLGHASAVVAGGADSLSTAPWRIARPQSAYQLPQFIRTGPDEGESDASRFEASDRLAAKLDIARAEQDRYAFDTFARAGGARESGGFIGEIVAIRANAEEARDESAVAAELDDIEAEPAFNPPDGTATAANTSSLRDGAAMTVLVSDAIWQGLGRPTALRVLASAVTGVGPEDQARASLLATRKLLGGPGRPAAGDVGAIEISEGSAVEAIAFAQALGTGPDVLNSGGGAIARGHAYGAAGAVLAARLFTRMVRDGGGPNLGIAAVGGMSGMAMAALFERV